MFYYRREGLSYSLQCTINDKVSACGVGLHSGENTTINLLPAKANTGIIFRRIDIADKAKREIKADYKNVSNTVLCTTISNEYGVSVSTIEHIMAALWGCGIDNIIIELDQQELPIMDGSAEPFVFLIECAGIKELSAPRKIIEILKEITVTEGDASLTVAPSSEFEITLDIDFENKVIAKQTSVFDANSLSFKLDLARARTFGLVKDVEYLRSIGLAKGASLDNAIAVSEDSVLNEHGLRYNDEFSKHKILDSIGDFYLAGGFIQGKFHANKSGHALNNKLLHKIFATKDAFRVVDNSLEQLIIINNSTSNTSYQPYTIY